MKFGRCLKAVLVLLLCISGNALADHDREYAVGQKVVNFILHDSEGNEVALSDFNDKQSIVLYTMGIGCPISNLYSNELNKMQEEFGDKGLQIIGIHDHRCGTGVLKPLVICHLVLPRALQNDVTLIATYKTFS